MRTPKIMVVLGLLGGAWIAASAHAQSSWAWLKCSSDPDWFLVIDIANGRVGESLGGQHITWNEATFYATYVTWTDRLDDGRTMDSTLDRQSLAYHNTTGLSATCRKVDGPTADNQF
jgi:hypothetical protein